jgi:cbb3-type cytochrome oxidase subunit 3
MLKDILKTAGLLIIAIALLLGALALWRPTARQIEAAGRAEIDKAAARAMRADTDMSWVLVIGMGAMSLALGLLSLALLGVVAWLLWDRRKPRNAPPPNWEG